MWITVYFNIIDSKLHNKYKDARVVFNNEKTIPKNKLQFPSRSSQIYPISKEHILDSNTEFDIYFYYYQNPFQLIGKLLDEGSQDLKQRVWFNIGLSSILLITKNGDLSKELTKLADQQLISSEYWKIENTRIVDEDHNIFVESKIDTEKLKINEYDSLPTVDCSSIDEFVANICLIISKVSIHNIEELDTYYQLIVDVNILIQELVYVKNIDENIPITLKEFTKEELLINPEICTEIYQQNIERIIQINSALSYISTQTLSGAVPILERRSLIRRHSLLGIGSAAMALNRISRSIENLLKSYPIQEIILNKMEEQAILPGTKELLNYDSNKWEKHSFDRWRKAVSYSNEKSIKIPFFSGRLGFRETEYTISAAIQCISSGASLEWNLITLTHELMHSHVREILTTIFHGNKKSGREVNQQVFYAKFLDHIYEKVDDLTFVDSIRNLILTYTTYTYTHGSLTRDSDTRSTIKSSEKGKSINPDLFLLNEELLWQHFEQEYRNINEIIVHVLDYHYFYGGRILTYIPLIWKSWASISYINGDIRQYILRSLLVISIRYNDKNLYQRFKSSVSKFKQIIDKHVDGILNLTVIQKIIEYLEDENKTEDLIYPFKASLYLVDLADNIFVSKGLIGSLYDDEFIDLLDDDDNLEMRFIYNFPAEFANLKVQRPVAYLLDRYIRQINEPIRESEIERTSALFFLAINSK